MKTNPPKPGASRWGAFLFRLEEMLANQINDLYLFVSLLVAKWMVKREVKRRQTRLDVKGYEAAEQKLLVALRRKIPKKRSKQ